MLAFIPDNYDPDDYNIAYQVAQILQHAGFKALFAGGWVRNKLLGIPSDDIDIATDATPEEIEKLFHKTILVGAQFGVVRVLMKGREVEVATFRIDDAYLDGRHPSSIKLTRTAVEDARRRDFTINGLFYDPFTHEILDFVGGRVDLERHLIRAIGDPIARFTEDRLRMVRAIRFAVTLGFSIEEKTMQAIQLLADRVRSSVSPERLWQELKKIQKGQVFVEAISLFKEAQLFYELFPGGINDELLMYAPSEAPLASLVAILIPDPQVITKLFRISTQEQKIIEKTVQLSLDLAKPQSDVFWVKWYSDPLFFQIIPQALLLCMKSIPGQILEEHRNRQEALAFWVERVRNNKPLVTAEMLKSMGVMPGREMGILLRQAEEIAISKRIKDSETLLRWLPL